MGFLSRPIATRGFFVLGMHRSGTSCLTGLLETSGLHLGEVSRYKWHNRKGTLESRAVNKLNERILKQFGGSWDAPPAALDWARVSAQPIRQLLRQHAATDGWVLKDPRLLLTLPAWLPHVRDHRLVGTYRHPAAVARSLERREGIAPRDGVALWARYNRELRELHRHAPFPLTSFDRQGEEYLEQFRCVAAALELPFDATAARAFYHSGMVSQSPDESVDLGEEARELYRYLRENTVEIPRAAVTESP